jgi:hypothetical protein
VVGATHEVTVPGSLSARVVNPRGDLVALTSGPASSTYRPLGRASTTIVVADRSGQRGEFLLPGCVEPEAFSLLGEQLYVLDYLPPQAPERYRVRVLNLTTGTFEPLLTRDKSVIPAGAEEEMRGEGRQAVHAPAVNFLFTLYTHQPEHEHTRDLISAREDAPQVHAFVHSLSLDGAFAYCIDLPAPFGEGPPEGHAIALAVGGRDPVVVDVNSGNVAVLDGQNLSVTRVVPIPPVVSPAPAFAALAEGQLFVGSGTGLRVLRADSLHVVSGWTVPSAIRGLALSPDGARLWVGQDDRLIALDPATGAQLASVAVPGLTALTAVHARPAVTPV